MLLPRKSKYPNVSTIAAVWNRVSLLPTIRVILLKAIGQMRKPTSILSTALRRDSSNAVPRPQRKEHNLLSCPTSSFTPYLSAPYSPSTPTPAHTPTASRQKSAAPCRSQNSSRRSTRAGYSSWSACCFDCFRRSHLPIFKRGSLRRVS